MILAALPRQNGTTKHHKAVPHGEVRRAVGKVRESGAPRVDHLALEFLVLTAARSIEVRGAHWAEIDGDTWTIPAERMKSGNKAHRVPLSGRALEILEEARALSDGPGLVFPSPKKPEGGAPLSTLLDTFKRARIKEATAHGLRSSFRDWCSELAKADRATAEAALAHVVKGVEGAYFRSELLDAGREVMET